MTDTQINSSKRPRTASASITTASKSSRISQSANIQDIICRLPPTCHFKPTVLVDTTQLESHYLKCHTHVCVEERCGLIFPESRFLYLHQTECHDPIAAIRKEKGERTFSCFDTNCNGVFRTPKGRRLHLIDKHKYPPNFYFAVTNYGIGRSLLRWGEGASLLRKEWKPRVGSDPHMDCSEGIIECTSEALSAPHLASLSSSKSLADSVDVLTHSMSSLSLFPPAIRFGRGGAKSGFQRSHSRGDKITFV